MFSSLAKLAHDINNISFPLDVLHNNIYISFYEHDLSLILSPRNHFIFIVTYLCLFNPFLLSLYCLTQFRSALQNCAPPADKYTAKSAKYLAFRISTETALVLFTGIFGWQGSPAVWAVFYRALGRVITLVVDGVVIIYVDDFMGFGSRTTAHADQLKVRNIICDVFGPDAINIEKSTLPCRVCDTIGWTIDLDAAIIYPNQKGCKKIAAAFFTVDVSKVISVRMFQRLGSLATRYSAAITGTRPFVHAFFEAFGDDRSKHASSSIKLCILIWRAVALILLHDPKSMAVPLVSLSTRHTVSDFYLTTDAGPEGLGVVLRDNNLCVLAFLSYKLPFIALESKFQNVREFLGVVLGTFLACQFRRSNMRLSWTNDNTSALSWARADMARSRAAQASFLVLSWCKIKAKVEFSEITHIAGVDMGDVDSLSRFLPVIGLEPQLDRSSSMPIILLNELFSLCDPTKVHQENLYAWEVLFNRILSLIDACLVPWRNLHTI